MVDGSMVEAGIGGLLAITILKTVLPYVKPAKNGHVAKEVCETLKPVMDRQLGILDRMNEREITMNDKIVSDHETIKHTDKVTTSINTRIDDIYHEMPKGK